MSRFTTTRWSLVLRAGQEPGEAKKALEVLCSTYRPPVLAFIRQSGYTADAAEDLVQAFFLEFLEHTIHANADPSRGRFRTFLLTVVERFLIGADRHANRQKRGGGVMFKSLDDEVEQAIATNSSLSPEVEFERVWGMAVLDAALRRLREEALHAGKGDWFDQLSDFVTDPTDRAEYSKAAAALGVRPNTLAVAVHRFRQRLRALVREELKETTTDNAELEDELQVLRSALSASGLSAMD